MSDLRAYAVLTAVPALLAFGSGTATAQPAAAQPPIADGLEVHAVAPDPNSLRMAAQSIPLPEGINPQLREQAQNYLDGAQQQIINAYNGIGLPRVQANRADSTMAGQVIGAIIGKVAVFPLEIVGCGVGATVGAIAGGVIGALPTVGAGAPVGAAVGGVAGCLIGGLAVAIPVDVVGLAGGAALGGLVGNALGTDAPPAAAAVPVANSAAPQADPLPAAPVAAPIAAANTVAAIAPAADTAVTSLRSAIAALPPLTPDALGPLSQPANDLLAAVQAAF
ncbi:hypothetical protein [Nocardia sp. NPDC056100]|uniref:hypothetical protein n=1 Tax=Nocardia sp. NPDC056100 TaxID=3345712 RepID=UPI0035DB5E26